MYLAPFFGMPPANARSPIEQGVIALLSCSLEELVLNSAMPTHMISRNRNFTRGFLMMTKSTPFLSFGLFSSICRNHNKLLTYANRVTYPYLLVLGEHDVIVNNEKSRQWHQRTSSQHKELKLMQGAYHEVTKEPNSAVLFESMLRFINKRLASIASS